MVGWLRREAFELWAGLRMLHSREFWQEFRRFYSGPEVAARIDEWTARTLENTGQEPNWDVERRRARRHAVRD